MTIVPLSVASRGFAGTALNSLTIASRGFLVTGELPVAAGDMQIEIIGTPIDTLAARGVMGDESVAALGSVSEFLARMDLIQERANALGEISDAPLDALGMITDSVPVEDIAGDPDTEAFGEMDDSPMDARGGMADKLDARDIITEDPEDAEGEMSDAAIDVEGEMT